jgi:branched-chain amino acid aminotransferase
MIVFLNGQFLPEAQATVSVFDRSFLYGDGLFETLRVANGRPFRWGQHLERLRRGGDFLGLKIPFRCKVLEQFAAELIARNQCPEALLRVTVSRGVGPRGYSPKGADQPLLVMTLHPLPGVPASWRLITSSFRLPAGEPLAHFKTANKLAQVLARAEADRAGADEALLQNTDGFVVEGASSNLFWVEGDTIGTSPLNSGILAGVTRAVILELCREFGWPCVERPIVAEALPRTHGVFLSLSSFGVVAATTLDELPLSQSPRVTQLSQAYGQLLERETRKA